MSGFYQGDLLIVKQAAVLYGCNGKASLFVPDEPKLAVFLGEETATKMVRILIGTSKWLVRSKDCTHYNKKFMLSRRKNEQNSN